MLCACGCGRETAIAQDTDKRRGAIKGQPNRFLHGHRLVLSWQERFWQHIRVGSPDECWEWQAGKSDGYGRFSADGHVDGAHCIAYRLTYGPIPDGLIVCHTCNNRPCCNPVHLYAGTIGDNNQDSMQAGTMYHLPPMYGEAHPQAKLTNEDVRYIRTQYANGATTTVQLARQFGIRLSSIWRVIKRQTWRHIP